MTAFAQLAMLARSIAGFADEIRALLLAGHSGPWRICPSRAGGGGRRLCRCRARYARHGCDDRDDGARRYAALCPTILEGGETRDRADRQYPALSRRAPWAGAES